eukprot:TRINITY_DN5309_c0_g1_i1.p1 TRINITY_DN5309_c0_g1~~TRINITY_DN5309_c0_g1_i1.p1  ORF type:complete len:1660 (+),score=435.78 TRINITY_DN5309_c0_g1_i1:388-4980(+)
MPVGVHPTTAGMPAVAPAGVPVPQQAVQAPAGVATSLSTARPTWTPTPTVCSKCKSAFSLVSLRLKHSCGCCTRLFCDACCSKRINSPLLQQQGALAAGATKEGVRVCDSCFRHLFNSDKRCLSRLVPYLAEDKDDYKEQALREVLELMKTSLPGGFLDDIVSSSCLTELRNLLKNQRHAPMAAKIICSVVGLCASDSPSAPNFYDPVLLSALLDSLANAPAASPAAAPPAAASGSELTRDVLGVLTWAAQLDKARPALASPNTLRELVKLLTVPDELVVIQVLSLLDTFTRVTTTTVVAMPAPPAAPLPAVAAAAQAPGAVPTLVPCTTLTDVSMPPELSSSLVVGLVALLQSKSPAVLNFVLAVLDNLTALEPNKLTFDQASGVKTLAVVLPAIQNPIGLQHALNIVEHLSQLDQCTPSVASALPAIMPVATQAQLADSPKRAVLRLLANLSHAEATQRTVNQVLVPDYLPFLILQLSLPDLLAQQMSLSLMVAFNVTHSAILGELLREGNAFPLLLGIAMSPNPNKLASVHVLALCAQDSENEAAMLVEARFVFLLLDLITSSDVHAQLEGMQALWCISKNTCVKKCFASIEGATARLLAELPKPSALDTKIALCGVLQNVCTEPACCKVAMDWGIFKQALTFLASPNASIVIQILRVLESICMTEQQARDLAMQFGVVNMVFPLLGSPNSVVAYRSALLIAVLSQSATVRQSFIAQNNLPALLKLLSSRDADIQEKILLAITSLSVDDAARARLRACNGIEMIVELLFSENPRLQTPAAQAIGNFAFSGTQDCAKVLNLGGILALVSMLDDKPPPRSPTPQPQPQQVEQQQQPRQPQSQKEEKKTAPAKRATAAAALTHLCADPECLAAAVSEGAMRSAMNLLQSENDEEVTSVLLLMSALGASSQAVEEFSQSASFRILCSLTTVDKYRDTAVKTLMTLCNSEDVWELFGTAVGVAGLIPFLSSQNVVAQKKVISFLSKMTAPEDRETILSSGGLPPVVALLSSPNMEVQELAAVTLRNLSVDEATWQPIIDYGGVSPLLSLLNTQKPVVCLTAVTALAQISRNATSHKPIFELGGLAKLMDLLFLHIAELQLGAVKTLSNLIHDPQVCEGVCKIGGVFPIASLLASPVCGVFALDVLHVMCENSNVCRSLVTECGPLFEILSGSGAAASPAATHKVVDVVSRLADLPEFASCIEKAGEASVKTLIHLLTAVDTPTPVANQVVKILRAASRCKNVRGTFNTAADELLPTLYAFLHKAAVQPPQEAPAEAVEAEVTDAAETTAASVEPAPSADTPPAAPTFDVPAICEIVGNVACEPYCRAQLSTTSWVGLVAALLRDEKEQKTMCVLLRAVAEVCSLDAGRKCVVEANMIPLVLTVVSQPSNTLDVLPALHVIESLLANGEARKQLLQTQFVQYLSVQLTCSGYPAVLCSILSILKTVVFLADETSRTVVETGALKSVLAMSAQSEQGFLRSCALGLLAVLLQFDEIRNTAQPFVGQWLAMRSASTLDDCARMQLAQLLRFYGQD